MKKLIFITILTLLLFGCSNSQKGHEVVLDEIGLTYTTPAEWIEFETSNIYPLTIQSNGTLARIIYNYIKADDIEKLNDVSDSGSYTDYLTPICEIMVATQENYDTLDNITSLYSSSEKVSQQGEYCYYVLYNCSKNNLDGKDAENFKILSNSVPKLIESISTKDFNPDDVKPIIDDVTMYLTFDTKTLEGESINSSVFSQYDVTMVNFWGTYAIDKSNEQKVLQEVYENCGDIKDKKVNVINAIVDTPDEINEEIVKQLKQEAKGTFTTIVMDNTLANWAVDNLEGVPTTVFVNSDGKIISEQIKGAKSAETYMSQINEMLGGI